MFPQNNVCGHKIPGANLDCIYIYSAWTKDIHNVNNSLYLPPSQQPDPNETPRNGTTCAAEAEVP